MPTQFGLIRLFQATSIAALIFALTAPVLRIVIADASKAYMVFCLAQIVALVAFCFHRKRQRESLAYTAGQLLYRSPRFDAESRYVTDLKDKFCLVVVVVYSLLAASTHLSWSFLTITWVALLHPAGLVLQVIAFDTAARTISSWWYGLQQHTVEVYERGFCTNLYQFKPLENVADVRVPPHKPGMVEIVYADATLQNTAHQWTEVSQPEAFAAAMLAALRRRDAALQPERETSEEHAKRFLSGETGST